MTIIGVASRAACTTNDGTGEMTRLLEDGQQRTGMNVGWDSAWTGWLGCLGEVGLGVRGSQVYYSRYILYKGCLLIDGLTILPFLLFLDNRSD